MTTCLKSLQKYMDVRHGKIVLSGALNRVGYRPFFNNKEKKLAIECLKTLHIEDLKNKSFGELSGGQRQKVLLARALCATRECLVLDEPSNNLDYDSKEEFYAVLKELHQKGLTIIMITHDLASDEVIGNKILHLDKDNYRMEELK